MVGLSCFTAGGKWNGFKGRKKIAAQRRSRDFYLIACGPAYSAASASGFLNWSASVEAPIAVVEAAPPDTATATASK